MTEVPRGLEVPEFVLRHFSYEIGIFLPAPPPKVWAAFTLDLDHWWTYRLRERTRCIIEPGVGGRWVQAWDSGGALFGTFTVWDPPRLLVLDGPLAMTTPAHNRLEFEFAPVESATKLWIRHRAYGDFDVDAEATYVNGWRELIGSSLHEYLSKG
jgi:uncharacterized protein YndB with AHSA1/START domain